MLKEKFLKNRLVLEAWANGVEIEQRWGLCPWEAVGDRIDLSANEFRIKPKVEYIPFDKSDIEFLKGKWVISKEDPSSQTQITFFKTIDCDFYISGASPETLLEYFTFLDGSPCGKVKK